MKKIICLAFAVLLLIGSLPAAQASWSVYPPELLVSLTHNAPNTGRMLPENFDPYQKTYLLTVASWVSNVYLTPTTAYPTSTVTMNGQPVASGQQSQVFKMTDNPQAFQIVVSAFDASNVLTAQSTYTVYLQRRPSERRTRVSAGNIEQVVLSGGIATIHADLVTVKYQENSNLSTFTNETVDIYKHKTAPNCLFYYGNRYNPTRAANAQEFANNYLSLGSKLYTLIYIEDQIVAVMPYGSDY